MGSFYSLLKRRGANVALEFALAAPILVILLVGLVELGFALYASMQIQYAVETGAEYAVEHGWDSAGIVAAVQNAGHNAGIAASPAPVQFCGCPNAGAIATVSCSATCTSGAPASRYVRVSASVAHVALIPGLPLPATLTARSTVRLP
ncbi:MAG TPA: TadE/TadG family type IV pilus assembly protein [Rhizomicrobium sp.]|nr:TadE/TadG family type IV pilus assembly protein [Rhizomicrobium sp.]